MFFYYYMHGLYFESETELYDAPELELAGYHVPDVKIRISDHFLPEFEDIRDNTMISSDERIWFRTDIGSFLIEDGKMIYVSPLNTASKAELSAYIIGWCMCYLFFQRNKLGIHCSALSYKDIAFMISGESGAGKSTTALSMLKRGCGCFSDDIAFVSSDDGYMIHPSLPLQKMCTDVADSSYNKNELLYIDERKDKYALIDKNNFDTIPKPLSVLFVIRVGDTAEVEHEEISGIKKVSVILDSLFMAPFYSIKGFPNKVKAECLRMAGAVRVIMIKRPKAKETVARICDIIEKYLEEACQR